MWTTRLAGSRCSACARSSALSSARSSARSNVSDRRCVLRALQPVRRMVSAIALLLVVVWMGIGMSSTPSAHSYVLYATESTGDGRIMRSRDAGVSWQPVATKNVMLSSLAFPDAYTVVAVGASGSIFISTPSSVANVSASLANSTVIDVYSSRYIGSYNGLIDGYLDKANLLAASNSSQSTLTAYYRSLSLVPSSTVWTDAYPSFVNAVVSPANPNAFRDICFLNARIGIVVGDVGVVYRTENGGGTWTSRPSGSIRDLTAVSFATRPNAPVQPAWVVVAVGHVGVILRSNDSGLTWSTVYYNYTLDLYTVTMYSETLALAAGTDGALIRSTNGGLSWTYKGIGSFVSLYSIAFASSQVVYLSGESACIFESLDGGLTFHKLSLTVPHPYERFSTLFFTPSVAIGAIRDRFLKSLVVWNGLLGGQSALLWDSVGNSFNINSLSSVRALDAPILAFDPPIYNVSIFYSTDGTMNFSVSNIGTGLLHIYSWNSTLDWVTLIEPSDASFTATPHGDTLLYHFLVNASSQAAAVLSFTGEIRFWTNTPRQVEVYQFTVLLTAAPTPVSFNWLATYWYVPVVSGASLFIILALFIRRRLKYVKRYNKRVRYIEDRISPWGCWFWTVTEEHDSDSDYWLDEDDVDSNSEDDIDSDSASDSISSDEDAEFSESEVSRSSAGSSAATSRGARSSRGGGSAAENDAEYSDSISDQDYNDGDFRKGLKRRTTAPIWK